MARPYTISINNGIGTENILNGDYTVTSATNGYDNTSIDPASITVSEETNTYNLTISANGTLTLHVTEDGTTDGTAVVGATFKRCDLNGNEYGTTIISDISGNAIFNNVPYAITDAPTIYYKQIASDGDHEFDNTLKNITLTTETNTLEVVNTLAATRTINFTDTNYDGLLIENGQITLS